jgi:hypothetical protein
MKGPRHYTQRITLYAPCYNETDTDAACTAVFYFSAFARADTDIDHLLSLDLAYSVTGFMNQGWGLGLSYEEKKEGEYG